MTDLAFLTGASVLLIAAAVSEYRWAKRREAMAAAEQQEWDAVQTRAQEIERRWASMDAAMTDMNGRCWVCTAEAGMLELVDIGHRYELACTACAEILKATKRQGAA